VKVVRKWEGSSELEAERESMCFRETSRSKLEALRLLPHNAMYLPGA
jgi:hypothetical protein